MENPTLPTNWLAALSNANHDGTTLQIDDAFEISSKTYRHQASSRRDDETGPQNTEIIPIESNGNTHRRQSPTQSL